MFPVSAQDIPPEIKPHRTFQQISLEHGLSQSIVEAIVQDQQGFLWFATEDGLNRYDGYGFRIWHHDPDDLNSLSYSHIQALLVDVDSTLWIGTFGSGLNHYKPLQGTFTHYRSTPRDSTALPNETINALYRDPSGALWIGTNGGLARLATDRKTFTTFTHHPDDPLSLSDNRITAICPDSTGHLWIGTENGVNRFDPRRRAAIRFFPSHDGNDSPAADFVQALCFDRQGALWIGTRDGLFCMHHPLSPSRTISSYRHRPGDPHSLAHNDIQDIIQERSGILWIATNGGGLQRLLPGDSRFDRFQHDPRDPSTLSFDYLKCLYQDHGGVLWVGTYGDGLNKLCSNSGRFPHFRQVADDPVTVSQNIVWCFYLDGDNVLWVGTHGGGLMALNRRTGEKRTYRHDAADPHSLNCDVVRSICVDRAGRFWVGTDGGGISRFDPAIGRFTPFRHDPHQSNSLSHDEIRVLYQDRHDRFWVGTYGGGLDLFDPDNGTFVHYRFNPDDSTSLSNDYIRDVYEDSRGNLWVATQGGGLNRMEPSTGRFERRLFQSGAFSGLGRDHIFCIHEGSDGLLWLGSWGAGLIAFDRDSGTCRYFDRDDGLPSNSVYGVLEDDQGCLWLSSNNGLTRFDPRNEILNNYGVDDGLQSTEFNGGAYFSSADGEMFFGGINGFNAFFPNEIKENTFIPPVVITSIRRLNESLVRPESLAVLKELTVPYGQAYFAIEFAALDYTAPDKNSYAYRLEGLDDEWMVTDSRNRLASYTFLPPGSYQFHVRGSNNDQVWNEKGRKFKIVVLPPFYQTWLFRLSLVALLVILAVTVYRNQLKKSELKRRKLEASLQERILTSQALQNALDEVERLANRLEAENTYLQSEMQVASDFENIITRSEKMKAVLRQAGQVAGTDATVLILGESGTGKELVARAIHRLSPRRDRLLVKVNCSALPPQLIESEFFGHEKGAFTGAVQQKSGRFELADGGTLFLDEIGDLPLELQAKLLRVLQEGEFERVGGTRTIRVNVRVIAATNRELEQIIKDGQFRQDLYFRLNVFPVHLPPLRERKEDIPLLVAFFIKKHAQKLGNSVQAVTQSAIDDLSAYHWPGNVRELENVIERALITSPSGKLQLVNWLPGNGKPTDSARLPSLEENERRLILRALEYTSWKVSGRTGAANLLHINPKTLESRMRKLDIRRPTLAEPSRDNS
ncbi:sigma 54-interacting transcriptional regulator [candidate division KSB1 bacterium]|nr:sigma 54-interacting transcriptional regulator [candidate division KSB1 bacterium]